MAEFDSEFVVSPPAGLNMNIEVAGTIYADVKTCRVSRSISDFNTSSEFTLTLDSPAGRHDDDFSVGNEIKIYADEDIAPSTNIFTGVIERVSFSGEENTQVVALSGRDYTSRLMDVTIEPSVYTSSEISTIVLDIINNYVTGLTTVNVDTTTTTIKRIAFNQQSVFEGLKQLAKLAGFIFYVDENKDLHFELRENTSSGYTLDNTNIVSCRFDKTREGMANDIWVYGDRYLSGFKEIKNMNGGSVATLISKPHNTIVDYLGSSLKGGVFELTVTPTSGADYLVSYHDKQLIFQSGTDIGYSSIPVSGGSVVVTYNRDIPIAKHGLDRNSIRLYGPKNKIINDKSIKDPNTAIAILKKELEDTDPFRRMEIELKGWFELTPGQTVDVVLDNFGLDEQDIGILDITYDFNPVSVRSEKIITVRLDKKVKDITDAITDLKNRLEAIESQDRQDSDVITRLETGFGDVTVVGSEWSIKTRTINDSYIASHPQNGVNGIVHPSGIGSIFGTAKWVTGTSIANCYNRALAFTGSPSRAEIHHYGDINFGSGDSYSVTFWYNTQYSSPPLSARYIVQKGISGINPPHPFSFVQITDASTTNGIRFGVNNNDNSFSAVRTTGSYNDGNWHHIAGVKHQGRLFLYVDGSIIGSTTDSSSGAYSNTEPIVLGGKYDGVQSWVGSIDDLRIYNKNLSSGEVGSLNSGSNVNGSLVGYWKLDEGVGSTIYNSASGGNAIIQPLVGDRRSVLTTVRSGGYTY